MKRNKKFGVVLAVVILATLCVALALWQRSNFEQRTEEEKPQDSGQSEVIRMPESDCKELYDLGFGGYNENRLLKVKMKVGEQYIYESGYVKPSQVMDETFFEKIMKDVQSKECMAEIYSYTLDEELIGVQKMELRLK